MFDWPQVGGNAWKEIGDTGFIGVVGLLETCFKFSKVYARTSLAVFSSFLSVCCKTLLHCHVCLFATMFSIMTVMDLPTETLSKSPTKCFYL